MSRKTSKLCVALTVASVLPALWAAPAQAAPLTVNNFSFEAPARSDGSFGSAVTDWTATGGQFGSQNFQNSHYPGATGGPLPAPADGNQAAYYNAHGTAYVGWRQSLGTIQSDTIYTATVAVGRRLDLGLASWAMYFTSDQPTGLPTGVLATVNSSTGNNPAPGTFVDNTFSFNSNDYPNAIGQTLYIFLSSDPKGGVTATLQVNYDNVRVDATPTGILVPGDFDGDGDVDGADFVAWQTNYPTLVDATREQGDADADGDVDGADFAAWQDSFPNPSAGTVPVPEPAVGVLILAGLGTVGIGWLRGAMAKANESKLDSINSMIGVLWLVEDFALPLVV